MIFPKHVSLSLEHNPHRGMYQPILEYYEGLDLQDDDWVNAEQRDLALKHDDVWELRWYPKGMITFHVVLGYDLYAVVARALQVEEEHRPRRLDE